MEIIKYFEMHGNEDIKMYGRLIVEMKGPKAVIFPLKKLKTEGHLGGSIG